MATYTIWLPASDRPAFIAIPFWNVLGLKFTQLHWSFVNVNNENKSTHLKIKHEFNRHFSGSISSTVELSHLHKMAAVAILQYRCDE
jgi:hypothetical protein